MSNQQFEQFKQEIANLFDWESVKKEAIASAQKSPDGEGLCYLGTTMSLTPSGKYYTPWANSNVTDEEAEFDEQWLEALTSVAEDHELYITDGEGSATDIFAGFWIEKEEEPEE